MKTPIKLLPVEAFANDAGYGNNAPGVVCAANESRFDQAFYDAPLTEYLVGGWDQDPLEELLEFFSPAVDVPRRFHYKEFLHADEFWSDDGDEDIRAIGAEFNREKPPEAKTVHDRVPNKGLTTTLDRDEDTGPLVEQRRVNRLMRRLRRNDLRRSINLLIAASVNQALTWDTTAGKDPDQDIIGQLLLAKQGSGVRPSRVGYGETAWTRRGLSHRAQNNAGGFASARMTPPEVAALLGVEGLSMTDARYKDGAGLTEVIGNLVLMFNAASGLSQDDPSNIKRFVANTVDGGRVRVYRREVGPKLVELTVEHYSKPTITSTLGVRRATIS